MVSPNFPDEKFYGNILKARSIDKNILRQNLNLNVKSKKYSAIAQQYTAVAKFELYY